MGARFTDRQGPRAMWAGLALSVAAHAGVGALVVARGGVGGGVDDRVEDEASVLARVFEPPRVTIGQDDGSPVAISWLGYEAYRRHVATPWVQDQAAFTPSASESGPLPAGDPVEVVRESEVVGELAAGGAAGGGGGALVAEAGEGEGDRADGDGGSADGVDRGTELAEAVMRARALASSAIAAMSEAAEAMVVGDRVSARAEASSEVAEAAEAELVEVAESGAAGGGADASSGGAGAGLGEGELAGAARDRGEEVQDSEAVVEGGGRPGSGMPGDTSDRESVAASIERAAEVEWGQPLSARGLRIETVRPRYTAYTRVISARGEPVVRLSFGRDGRVRKAEFLRRSGNPHVDQSIEDAVFRWRASGGALGSLAASGPGSVIEIDVKISP